MTKRNFSLKEWLLSRPGAPAMMDSGDFSIMMMQTGGGFQTQVNVQPGVAVAGDFCSTNPRHNYIAGAGGLVAGPQGVTVGRFAWTSSQFVDDVGAPTIVNNFGSGPDAGFVHREQQGLITAYLADASMLVPQGFPVSIFDAGDFWVQNDGTTQCLPGMYAFATFANGKAVFGVGTGGGIGNASINGATVTGSIGPGTTTFTGSISGNVLTVSSALVGTVQIGGTLSGGTGMIAGTQIVSQLSGTTGGVGTYAVNYPEQTVAAAALTETYGTLNVTAVSSGTIGVGSLLTGTGASIMAGTTITALGTGAGGTGTYIVNITQTIASTTVSASLNVQTKWIARSSGLPGELVKMSQTGIG